jgi:hypothetical protein
MMRCRNLNSNKNKKEAHTIQSEITEILAQFL